MILGEVPPIPENKYLARRVDNEIKEKKDVIETSRSNRNDHGRENKEKDRLVFCNYVYISSKLILLMVAKEVIIRMMH